MAEQEQGQVQEREYEQYTPQTSGRLFNSAMFGFNKEEVLEYLDELADENYQRQEAAENRIQELTRKIQVLENAAVANAKQASSGPAANPKELEAARAKLQQVTQELEIAKAATQQAEEELLQFKEQLYTSQQESNWLREEYQKSDRQIAELRRQLDDASSGQWSDADEQITELRRQLQQMTETQQQLEEELEEAREAAQALDIEDDDADEDDYYEEQDEVSRAASVIIADANAEAQRIRAEAYEEKERIRRQIISSAGGLADSVYTLREDVSSVEGDVSGVLESVQQALSEVLSALGRTEQNLSTLGVQVERFPASAPPVYKNQQQVVYFQPAPVTPGVQAPVQSQAVKPANQGGTIVRSTPQQSYEGGNFRRVWPDEAENAPQSNTKPFRPTYSNSPAPYIVSGAEAYQQQREPDSEERLRALSDTLVETLRQMLT